MQCMIFQQAGRAMNETELGQAYRAAIPRACNTFNCPKQTAQNTQVITDFAKSVLPIIPQDYDSTP